MPDTGKTSGFGVGEIGGVPASTAWDRQQAREHVLNPRKPQLRIYEFWTADGQPIGDREQPDGREKLLTEIALNMDAMADPCYGDQLQQMALDWIAANRPDLVYTDESPDGHGFSLLLPSKAEMEWYVVALQEAERMLASEDAERTITRNSKGEIIRECWDCGIWYTEEEVKEQGGQWVGDNPLQPGTCYCGG